MAPNESAEMLWSTLVNSKAIQKHFTSASVEQESVDSALLESLAECYNNATQWDTRCQILSIMVDKISLKSLQQYIPDITPYRNGHVMGTAAKETTQISEAVSERRLQRNLNDRYWLRSHLGY